MSQRWYYLLFSEEFGPVTEPQIRQLLDDGTLAEDDLVRPESSQTWLALSESFSDIRKSVVEAGDLTDLSELAFSFEESRTSTRRAANKTADLSERPFRFDDSRPTIGRSSHSPEPVPGLTSSAPTLKERLSPVSQGATTEAQLMYYCQSFGQTMGPMTIAELAGMAETGSLTDSDLVRFGADGDWFPAGELAEVAATLMLTDAGLNDADRMSFAQQERFGKTPDAGPAIAPESSKSSAETLPKPLSASAATPSKSMAAGTQETPVRKKNAKQTGKKVEQILLDEIFDEVFAEEDTPVRPTANTTASNAAAMSQSEPPMQSLVPSPMLSAPGSSGAHSLKSNPASGSQTAARLSSPENKRSPKQSRTTKFSLSSGSRNILIAGVLFAAAAGYVFQFGMPSTSSGNDFASYYATRVKASIAYYSALGSTPTERQWTLFSEATRNEFKPYCDNLRSSGMSDPKATACLQAMQSLISLTEVEYKDRKVREENFATLKKEALELNSQPGQ